MKRDLITEVICQALCIDYFPETRTKTCTTHSPTTDSQVVDIVDYDGHAFSITIQDLGVKKHD